MTSIQPNAPTNTQTIVQPKQPEAKPKEKSSISTGVKVAVGAGLTALAAAGIYIATKGKGGKNVKDLGKQIDSLTKECSNYLHNHRFEFESPQVGKRLEEISQLPKKERLEALRKLHSTLEHTEVVKNYIDLERTLPKSPSLPKGMTTLPDDVRQAYEQKDVIKTGELFKQHIDKLPNTRPAVTKGATVAESIENTFGKGSNIQPHTYDLSKESPVIGVYRNSEGYKDGLVGQEGIYFESSLITDLIPDHDVIITSLGHGFNNKGTSAYGRIADLATVERDFENADRKLVQFKMPDPEGLVMKISILSPNNKYTPLQKDMIKLIENPEKIDNSVFEKITRVKDPLKKESNLYKYLDYDVLLSAIQSMAKQV